MKTKFISLFLLLALADAAFSSKKSDKNWAIGASGIYNFQTNGFAMGARLNFPITTNFLISPQLNYFFPFNSIYEYYGGVSLNYKIVTIKNWEGYAFGAVYYNRWVNYNNFEGKLAVPNNFATEAGLGLVRSKGCLKPFVEQRYSFKWKEANLQIGILITFKECYKKQKPINACPSY